MVRASSPFPPPPPPIYGARLRSPSPIGAPVLSADFPISAHGCSNVRVKFTSCWLTFVSEVAFLHVHRRLINVSLSLFTFNWQGKSLYVSSIECFEVARAKFIWLFAAVCSSTLQWRAILCFSRRTVLSKIKKETIAVEFTSLIVAVFNRISAEYT